MHKPIDEESIFDDDELFVGETLNDRKMDQLVALRELCLDISNAEPSIKYDAYPFSNHSQNGIVILDFPEILFCASRRVMVRLSKAISLADDITMSTLGGGIRFSFGVQNMWADFHFEDVKK